MRTLRRRSAVRTLAGFTLIEIMLVVGIITVLMGAAIYYLSGNLDIAKEQRVRADIQAIAMQLKTYETLNLFLPSSEQGLKALVERPTTQPVPERWKQMFEKMPIDPWGHTYSYRSPGRKNAKGFDLFSLGADGTEGSEDDIGNWQN